MYVVASASARENYYPIPTSLFGMCKFKDAELIEDTVHRSIECYNTNRNG